uniref:PEP-CTERM protein-sorting domain-containing protein n=1 Tax=Solibacter usitatus (strain Ellin6076) TaxID=234267 RepID=Q027K3_SOLUE
MRSVLIHLISAGAAFVAPVSGAVIYNNLTPNNLMAVASRPGTPSAFEIEAGDDFLLTGAGTINSASFVGLLVPGPTGGSISITDVVVEMYRVFPNDSGPPSVGRVPTRVNSPSDVAFASRDSAASDLSFNTSTLAASFTALNSVQPGGIHPIPNVQTNGNGPITGQEVQINVTFLTPFSLPADHYFFVPQISLSNGGTFYWLSASRPITGAGTTPINPDLQSWTRDDALDPDWLRIGTDIVGIPAAGGAAPTFNAAFSLDGTVAPEPSSAILLAVGVALLSLRKLLPNV